MPYELRKEILTNIKIATGNIFSDDIYECLLSNDDLTINSLFADKVFQSNTIAQIINTLQYLNITALKEGLFILGHQYSWFESKIEILSDFQYKLMEIIADFQGTKQVYDIKISQIFDINKDKIKLSKIEFIKSMNEIQLSMPMRVLNLIYIDENFVATQSFDTNNIELFYN